MLHFATIVSIIAVAGAFACWIFGAVSYIRALRAISGPERKRLIWLSIVAWLFVRSRLQGAAAAHAANVNKAMVGFFACLMIAIAATSVATNLTRLSR